MKRSSPTKKAIVKAKRARTQTLMAAPARLGPSPMALVQAQASVAAAKGNDDIRMIFLSSPAGWSSIGNAWQEYDPFSQIDVGNDYYQRGGRQIYCDRLEIRATLIGGQSNLATDEAYNAFRIVVASYKGGIGAITPLATAAQQLHWPISRNAAAVDRVYYDETYMLRSPGRNSTGFMPATKELRLSIPIGRVYNFAGSLPATNFDHIVVSAISDSAAIPNPGFDNIVFIPYWRG